MKATISSKLMSSHNDIKVTGERPSKIVSTLLISNMRPQKSPNNIIRARLKNSHTKTHTAMMHGEINMLN